MRVRTRWSVIWGIVGGLTVLVGGFGARPLELIFLSYGAIATVAFAVTILMSGLAYALAPRLG